MKYFLFSISAFVFSACASYYKNLKPTEVETSCVDSLRPKGIASAWFSAGVDVMGKHISGLLLVKEMPDQSIRIVFTNEVGVTFFDFEFSRDGKFEVKKIINQLNKRVVIETLRKDFYLLSGLPFQQKLKSWRHNDKLYFGVEDKSERFYFITASTCTTLEGFEVGSERKKMVSITFEGEDARYPESILITHFTFEMTLTLKRIQKNAD